MIIVVDAETGCTGIRGRRGGSGRIGVARSGSGGGDGTRSIRLSRKTWWV